MHESRGAQIVDLEDYDMPPVYEVWWLESYATRDIAAIYKATLRFLQEHLRSSN